MNSLLLLIDSILSLYIWLVILAAIVSWLLAFDVINSRNQLVYTVVNLLYRLTEPVLSKIRRFLPQMGGLDLSPIVLILGIYFLRNLLFEYWPR